MGKKHSLCAAVVVAIGMAIATSESKATLISLTSEFGPDTITRDTSNSLDWLDLTLSLNRSYNDIIGIDGTNELSSGGDFDGFRYATSAEVLSLWHSGGLDPSVLLPFPSQEVSGDLYSVISDLMVYLGNTRTSGNAGFTGFVASTAEELSCGGGCTSRLIPEARLVLAFNPLIDAGMFVIAQGLRDDIADPEHGHWLVRNFIPQGPPTPLPEPSTITFMGGFAVLVFWRRWRPRKRL